MAAMSAVAKAEAAKAEAVEVEAVEAVLETAAVGKAMAAMAAARPACASGQGVGVGACVRGWGVGGWVLTCVRAWRRTCDERAVLCPAQDR